MNAPSDAEAISHCVARIGELAALGEPDRRALLQLGYNLGRLSELTGLGRAPFWDRWKGPVAAWDSPALESLARELHAFLGPAQPRRSPLASTNRPQPDGPERPRDD